MNAIEVKGLTKTYKNFELKNISFELPYGSIMGFVGENGAGKSTTIKAILGLISPNSGEVYVMGSKKLTNQLKEDLGTVLDEATLPEDIDIKSADRIMKNIYKSWNSEKFIGITKKFGLIPGQVFKTYSKGMKMKLSIAIALAHSPKILILDEATSGLDPIAKQELLDEFLEFVKDGKHSILMSSHITGDLEKICDQIMFIHKGKLMFSEGKDSIKKKYGIITFSKDEFERIGDVDKYAVVGYREIKSDIEALVIRNQVVGDYNIGPASIDDIMYHLSREGEK